MAVNFLNDVNINQNQLLNVVIENTTTDPLEPEVGRTIYRTDTNRLKVKTSAAAMKSVAYTDDAVPVHTHLVADITNLTGAVSTVTTTNLDAARVAISNANGKIAVSDITTTELGYLDGVTSNIQDQLNSTPRVIVTANPQLSPSSRICTWVINNQLHNPRTIGERTVYIADVTIYDASTSSLKIVYTDVSISDTGVITVKFKSSSTISAGTYFIEIIE